MEQPPPPPQAGKFKPRKPAKKISVGGVVAPDTVASSSAVASRPAVQGRGGRGGGGRGRGRTGRGSRAPIPQGKAFFTAQPAPQSALSGRGSNTTGSAGQIPEPSLVTSDATLYHPTLTVQQQQRQARRKRDGTNAGADDEEIVGTLDEAVGYSVNISTENGGVQDNHKPSKGTGSAAAATNLERALMGATGVSQTYQGPNGYMYDSDSSDDDDELDDQIGLVATQQQRPLTLPFPSLSLDNKKDSVRNGLMESNDTTTRSATNQQPKSNSQFPFINTTNNDAYFLVQLPTRLPPVIPKEKSNTDPMAVHSNSSDPDVRIVEPIAVATPPIQSNAFDNVLQTAKPGRIGTLQIYRSGKTVLVLDTTFDDTGGGDNNNDPHPCAPIVMNVSEGLRCEFQQQAVSIDLDQRTYTAFGPVNGTMVITPNL